MGKFRDIEILHNLGFNTPNVLLNLPQFDDKIEKHRMWKAISINESPEYPNPRVSIRTCRDGENLCPFHPNVPLEAAEKLVPELIEEGYEVMISEGIDPVNCLLRGNVVRRPDKPVVTLEWINGPGTVRDLEKATTIQHLSLTIYQGVNEEFIDLDAIPVEIRPLVKAYFETPSFAHKILEWSFYNRPVGRKKQPEICWEIREWR